MWQGPAGDAGRLAQERYQYNLKEGSQGVKKTHRYDELA